MTGRGERGSVSSLFLVSSWTLILFGLVVGADFGRVYFYREQMQTAADAAALAGAQQIKRMVKVKVQREVWDANYEYDCEYDGNWVKTNCNYGKYVSTTDGEKQGAYPLSWRNDLCSGNFKCTGEPTYTCWLEPKEGRWERADEAAAYSFWKNAQGTQWAPYVKVVRVVKAPPSAAQNNWGWFWVQVQTSAEAPTLLWGLLGKNTVTVSREGLGYIASEAKPVLRGAGGDPKEPPLVCG